MKKGRTALAAAAALCFCLSGCTWLPGSFSGQSEITVLTIGTADNGGTMYQVGSAIAQAITQEDESIKVNVGASTGSTMNVRQLEQGEVDLALVSGDIALDAYTGQESFSQPVEELRAVAAVYSSVSTWIAPSSVGAEYVHDLAGKTVGVGPQGSSSELAAQAALAALGLEDVEQENCSLASAPEKVDGRELDAIHGFSGSPIPGLWELAGQRPCVVLGYEPEELEGILKDSGAYSLELIPAGTYPGQEKDVESFGLKCLLCVNQSLDQQLVYELTRILWENREAFASECQAMQVMVQEDYLCADLPIPLHEGAEEFYRSLEE